MKFYYYFLAFALLYINSINAQNYWQTLNLPTSNRYDDIYFLNDTIGYTINADGQFFKTNNGGKTWQLTYNFNEYLRCLEFTDSLTGFIGSLDSSFFMTTNAGKTWVDLAKQIPQPITGVCGISIKNQTIYACGKWSGPAFVLKSEDNGGSWQYFNLDSLALGLVEAHFINEQIGYVAGRGPLPGRRAVILKTTNGGQTWKKIYEGSFNNEFIWKIETPLPNLFYASFQGNPAAQKLRILKSIDTAKTFEELTVVDTFLQSQVIGFFDENKGLVGGLENLFETFNGGHTWIPLKVGSSYNRFFKTPNNVAFLSGNEIYRYGPPFVGINEQSAHINNVHQINLINKNHFEVKIKSKTFVEINLISVIGKSEQQYFSGYTNNKTFTFQFPQNLPTGLYFICLHTNEGVLVEKVFLSP